MLHGSHISFKDPYGPYIGILGPYYPMWYTWVLYLIVKLIGLLQKPNVKIEDMGLALDIEMMEAYLYLIRSSFEDINYYISSIPILSRYLSLEDVEQHALDDV